jgi:hypothetical protein
MVVVVTAFGALVVVVVVVLATVVVVLAVVRLDGVVDGCVPVLVVVRFRAEVEGPEARSPPAEAHADSRSRPAIMRIDEFRERRAADTVHHLHIP